jgi:hypothetical protein
VEVVDPRVFLSGGKFREKDFRESISRFDWSQYSDKPVLIQGCGSVPFPTWAYLVIMAELTPHAKSISYGELKNPIPVLGKLGREISSFPAVTGGESMDPLPKAAGDDGK